MQAKLPTRVENIALVLWLLVIGCLAGCTRGSPSSPVAHEAIPDWSLSDEDSKLLAQPFELGQFEIRPPIQFNLVKKQIGPGWHNWAGPMRSDKSQVQLFVIIQDITDEDASRYGTPEAMFEDCLAGIKQLRSNWSHERIEHGKINGQPFLRTFWRGNATSEARAELSGRLMYGVVYMGQFGKTVFQIHCEDAAPNQVEAFKLGQLAASSFRLRQSKAVLH